MSERGCYVKVERKDIPEYLKNLREIETASTDIHPDSKLLIDKVIRWTYDKKIEPLITQPADEIEKIREEGDRLTEVDNNIITEIEECFNLVTHQLKKQGLEPFTRALLRKPTEKISYSSPLPQLAMVVSVSREDHVGILHDLRVRIENSSLLVKDKEILYQVVDSYKMKIENKCKEEDECVEKIKSRAEQLNDKYKPVYDSLKEMHSWISRLEAVSDLE